MELKFSLDVVESITFGLHALSLGIRHFNNFQLLNDADVDLVGTQMPQHVEGSREMSMRREAEDITMTEEER